MPFLRKLQEHPHQLEIAYQATYTILLRLAPLLGRFGWERLDRWFRGIEETAKRSVFDCQMCGQCVLHSTGMTCPMTCPKNLRNGPCGGVRADGHCEVLPDKLCVWVEAFERSHGMTDGIGELRLIQAPVDRRLEGTSAWINLLSGADTQALPVWHTHDSAGIPR
jgi:hypothetical protein